MSEYNSDPISPHITNISNKFKEELKNSSTPEVPTTSDIRKEEELFTPEKHVKTPGKMESGISRKMSLRRLSSIFSM